ncbi:hypothetical protein P153DRAFT_365269 [Dothidotthia symphoricarpi CBS 119687]|uniref:mRNA export factor GLE1 n=1 Tax=Dothidotthia symphoricarpi CBS 119687 TaxID=1392245 RepID=A0A6A6AKQ2_9PLEO|nr:uncharacterized protein P153DRAFT_365269 [Dothidotthia symphoricarpi CBS 119687]KAF2131698.1 hypothetical protein P153DRAFT_365269 [Dothidotthia symphoricarpi CBS 119687]
MPARSGTSSSSMHTSTSFSSSLAGSSPSRQSPSRHVRSPRGSLIQDPYDSPSRQLALEFNLRLSISDRDFNARLDQAAAERAKVHEEQLAKAAHEHQRVLRGAELELQRIALEEEQAKLRRADAQQKEVDRLQQEKAHHEAHVRRQQLEAKQREEEAARQAAEHQKRLHEAEARLRAQKDQEAAAERQRREKENTDRQAKETAAAAEHARAQQAVQHQQQQQQQPPTQVVSAVAPTPVAPSAPPASTPASASSINTIHAKYLELHTRMKAFRVAFQDKHKQKGQPLKEAVGNARRNIRLRLGQITTDRKDSVAAIKRLREECFNVALETPGPMIDIRHFIVSHEIPPLANEAEAQYPAFLLYVWICFEKSVLKQFEKEAANEDGRIIQEIGLIAASLLGDQRYMWKGLPLTDIILAKFHRLCPILFGIRGTMDTAEGRLRLGWMPIDKSPATTENYSQRMRGLGAGYASLSLRSFAAKAPAVPISEYWRAIVSICNTRAEDLWPGHFALLGGLIRDYYKKFFQFYGVQARGVLRRATVDLPARAPDRCKDAAGTVAVLPVGWKKDGISLD